MKLVARITLLFLLSTANTYAKKTSLSNPTPIKWRKNISQLTVLSSWRSWQTRYKKLKPELENASIKSVETQFYEAVDKGKYAKVPYLYFIKNFIFYNRFSKYPHAKTIEELYPLSDKVREPQKRTKDIGIVKYHLETNKRVSPICIARVYTQKGKFQSKDGRRYHLVKLDGGHRIVATVLKKSDARALFIEL